MRRRIVFGVGLVVAVLIIVLVAVRLREPSSSASSNAIAGSSAGSTAAATSRARTPSKPASVSGRVTRVADGAAIPGAVIAVARADLGRELVPTEHPTLLATSDATGAWTLPAVPPGDYTIGVSAVGFVPAERDKLAIASGEQRSGIDFALVAGGTEVRGTVSDVGGGPIAAARITATRQRMSMRSETEIVAMTGVDGTYRLTLADGSYSISAEHDDYTDAEKSVEIAGQPETIDFVLTPGAVIRGRVIARDTRQPVPRAMVDASIGGAQKGRERRDSSAFTDDNGAFQLRGLSSGAVSISAAGRGYASSAPTVVEVSIAETVDNVEVLVDRAYSITGRVVNQADPKQGVPGVQVGAFSFAGDGDGNRAAAPDPTDEHGAFEIVGVRPGTYMLFAGIEGMIPEIGQRVTVVDRDVTDVEIKLAAGVTLSGRVDPRAVATITLELAGAVGLANMFDAFKVMLVRADSDATGTFQLRNAPAGAFRIVARTKDGTTGKLDLTVGTTDQSGLIVPISPRASIAGTVIDKRGSPVPGMKVTARSKNERSGPFNISMSSMRDGVITKSDGAFKLVGLEPGTYEVRADDPNDFTRFSGNAEGTDKPVEVELAEAAVRTGVTITVEPRDGVIRGVVLGADRKPAPDAWVTARRTYTAPRGDGDQDWSFELSASDPVLTAADGRFSIERLRKGEYTLVVDGPRGSSRAEKTGVKPGDTVTITLAPLGTLAIRATVGGAPVASYDLSCDGPSDVRRQVTSADGSYKLERLAPGDYRCSASADAGTAHGKVTVPAGAVQLELAFTRWASLTGVVVNAVSGAPVQGALVFASTDDRGNSFGGDVLDVISGKGPSTDATGRFVLERVPPGSGSVAIMAKQAMGAPLGAHQYTASPGQRVDLGTIKVVPPVDGDAGTFGLATEPDGNAALKVTMVSDGGPAATAGLKVGDLIVSIDGRAVSEIGAAPATQMLSSGSVGVGQSFRLGLKSGATIVMTSAKWD